MNAKKQLVRIMEWRAAKSEEPRSNGTLNAKLVEIVAPLLAVDGGLFPGFVGRAVIRRSQSVVDVVLSCIATEGYEIVKADHVTDKEKPPEP